MAERPTAIDLFCGCGGFSLGFIQAGFEVVAAIESDFICSMIEKVSYPPYIELFARRKTEGWDVWGLDV